jgi:hypothetical protein
LPLRFRQAAQAPKTPIGQLEEYLRICRIECIGWSLTPEGQESGTLIGVRDEMIDTLRDTPTVRRIVHLGVSECIVQELLARDGLRATVWASASLETVVHADGT